AARHELRQYLASELENEWLAVWERTAGQGTYDYNPAESGRRRLHAVALGYLGALESDAHIARAAEAFEQADNMTDRMGALNVLAAHDHPVGEKALASFRKRYDGQPLVLDKWFALQATSPLPNPLERVKGLMG